MDNITGKLFSLFCSTWHTDLKMHVCEIISDLEGESKEKNLPGVIYKEEKWRNGGQKNFREFSRKFLLPRASMVSPSSK